jgi:hypothetical protein
MAPGQHQLRRKIITSLQRRAHDTNSSIDDDENDDDDNDDGKEHGKQFIRNLMHNATNVKIDEFNEINHVAINHLSGLRTTPTPLQHSTVMTNPHYWHLRSNPETKKCVCDSLTTQSLPMPAQTKSTT